MAPWEDALFFFLVAILKKKRGLCVHCPSKKQLEDAIVVDRESYLVPDQSILTVCRYVLEDDTTTWGDLADPVVWPCSA